MNQIDERYLRRRERENALARITYDVNGTPDRKLPDCPGCEQDELSAMRYGERIKVRCYACRFFYDCESKCPPVTRAQAYDKPSYDQGYHAALAAVGAALSITMHVGMSAADELAKLREQVARVVALVKKGGE